MRRKAMIVTVVMSAGLALSACSRDRTPQLLNVKSTGNGPDEFSVLPKKTLEQPDNLVALPTPTPGGSNRTDVTPFADATLALGGNPAAGVNDSGLVSHVTRFGVTPGIRTQLAQEDLDFRRRNNGRVLERVFNANVYFRAYRRQSLDQYAELEKLREAGIRTVSAPPESTQ